MSDAQGVNEPMVCCILLTRDRPEMAARAVRCFERQTYTRKRLLIFDTGERSLRKLWPMGPPWPHSYAEAPGCRGKSIGELRNRAIDAAGPIYAEIIVTFDDDDYSHPYRIAEQVNLLMTSKKQVVGFRDMLFWRNMADATQAGPQGARRISDASAPIPPKEHGEAWLYTHAHQSYCLGTSLCYWREVWERKPFPDQPRPGKMTGEDHDWLEGLDSLGWTSMDNPGAFDRHHDSWGADRQPRMIASIHGGNTSGQYTNMEPPSWKRAPEFDEHCRKTMEEA